MRILILANKDLASLLAINLLLKSAEQHIFSILLSEKVGQPDSSSSPLTELSFFEQTLFNDIVLPLSDKAGENRDRYLDSFETIKRNGVDLADIVNINSTDGLNIVSGIAPDLIVSIRFGQILQQPIIDIPELGVINLHSGILPNYRGVMATFWSMLHGEREIGTTLHFIDSNKIDAGSIIAIARSEIDYDKSYLHNVLSLYPQGVRLIVRAIERLAQDERLAAKPLDISLGRYFGLPDRQALNTFAEQGHQLIDYSEIVGFSQWFYQPEKALKPSGKA
ncbi:formyl transferase [Alteromonas flava]|uniref:formyl transferase n=1 Tax=Alteromonas flava TaxID=2048003 RepID=UPI000C28E9C2|nr:formyl transferase [Alteromonas flava]